MGAWLYHKAPFLKLKDSLHLEPILMEKIHTGPNKIKIFLNIQHRYTMRSPVGHLSVVCLPIKIFIFSISFFSSVIIIIMYSCMCYFYKMENIAHCKAKNPKQSKQTRACARAHKQHTTHARTHARTHTHTHRVGRLKETRFQRGFQRCERV